MSQIDSKTQRRIWFWLLLILGFFGFIYLIRDVLLPFLVGILAAYFLDPAADKLEEWGCSRNLATALITVGFFGIIAIVVIAIAPTVSQQLGELIEKTPEYYRLAEQNIRQHLSHLPFSLSLDKAENRESLNTELFSVVQNFMVGLFQSGLVLVNIVSLMVITPVVTFYLLRDWDRMVEKVDSLLPREYASMIETQMTEVDRTLAAYIRGQSNVMLILGVFYAVGLSIIGLQFAVLIGLLAGLLILIPYIGTFISGLLAVGVAYAQYQGEIEPIAIVAGFFIVGQMLEGYFLTPNLIGDRVGLHPAWVIFGMLAGGALFGFVGILLAVPVTAVAGVWVRFAISRYLESDFYHHHAQETSEASAE